MDKLVLRIQSKKIFEFFTQRLNLPHGKGKGQKVRIPPEVLSSKWKIIARCIRGIVDTDGSLFFAKKKGCKERYPSIEISTTSEGFKKEPSKRGVSGSDSENNCAGVGGILDTYFQCMGNPCYKNGRKKSAFQTRNTFASTLSGRKG